MRSVCYLFPAAIAALLTGPALSAQDLLGVAWNGATVVVDSHTAAVWPLGNGLNGQNALARSADGRFWSTQRLSQSAHYLTTVDPATGSASAVYWAPDLRGLTAGPGTSLLGIQYTPNASVLVGIDTATGTVSTIGSTGLIGVQGLAMHQGVLYGWDVFEGLVILDPATGAATDPFPGVGGPAYQQSLCSHPDGRLLLGGGDSNGPDQLFVVDVTTGGTSLIGTMPSRLDIRGLEPLGGFVTYFGQGCRGAHGTVSLSVTGRIEAGRTMSAVSTNHAPGVAGVLLVGLSNTTFQGVSLPRLLDPLIGTNGCSLYVSVDGSFGGTTGAGTPADLRFQIAIPPSVAGATFHLQHACVEPVPGNLSLSNGVTVHVR